MFKKSDYKQMTETSLWNLFKINNCLKARDELLRRYMPLADKLASKLYNGYLHCIELDDLCSYAYFGLLDAIGKFDVSLNKKFSTYAYTRITGAIIDEARKQSVVTRGTRKKLKLFNLFLSTCPEYFENAIDDQSFAKEFGLATFEYQQYKNHHIVSLDALSQRSANMGYSDNTDELDKIEAMCTTENTLDDPAHVALTKDLHEKLDIVMSDLSDRNKSILQDIYYTDLPLKVIAKKHSITPCAIFQIRRKSLNIIKQQATKLNLTSYISEAIA